MPKNGQNDLKFGHNMHYGDSNQFLKFCENLPKMMIFWPKIRFFKILLLDFWIYIFHGKRFTPQENEPIGLIFGIHVPQGYLQQKLLKIFQIFDVLVILWRPICAKMVFLLNFYSILIKKSPLGTHQAPSNDQNTEYPKAFQ